MVVSVVICALTVAVMIFGVLFFPKIRIGKIGIDSYWVIALAGACVLLASGQADLPALGRALVEDSAVNPLKILALFLSMTVLSVFLDELGFFRFLASVALRRARGGQKRLFFLLYLMVSVLTVFTSNDVIILSFTPFICYFAKNAKIDPMPYLAAEFVAANTWSMALLIGNPTNIYLATAYGVDFLSYLKVSILPTVAAGCVALGMLYLLFRKRLSAPIEEEGEPVSLTEKPLLWIGVLHLGVCTVLLAAGSYLHLEMWLVALCSAGSLFVCSAGYALVRRRKPRALLGCLKRAPYQLVPFMLSMFVMIVVLGQKGVTSALGEFLGTEASVPKYGVASFFASNLINNIPMSVLFASVIGEAGAGLPAVFATVIGSNLGAFFTPVGALAGLMFGSILRGHGLKFGYKEFLKLGVTVALPTLAAALGVLWLVV